MGGAKGPGIFFIIPCIDSYNKVDLRTVSFDVPPQEVKKLFFSYLTKKKSKKLRDFNDTALSVQRKYYLFRFYLEIL